MDECASQLPSGAAATEEGPIGGRGLLSRLVLPGGREPDPRFTLANERTFLAWMRTALAFFAGGIALAALPISGLPPEVKFVMSIMLLSVGLLIAVGAVVRWVRVERAMRYGHPLPLPLIVPCLGVACAFTCGALLTSMLM